MKKIGGMFKKTLFICKLLLIFRGVVRKNVFYLLE